MDSTAFFPSQAAAGRACDDPSIELTDPWPEPLNEAAYYGLAGEIVQTIEPHSEADPSALLVQVLVAFGNVAGRTAFFRAEADQHFGNLFVTLVGRTSKGRKGSSWGQIGRLFSYVDQTWYAERVQSGLSSGEGLIWAVRDAIYKREPVRESAGKGKGRGPVIDYEDVMVDQGVEDKRLLILESEFASVLKVAAREKNTLSPLLRQAWDTGTLRTLTKNSPAVATGAHISIVGHITRDELRRSITDTDMANGLANRYLWHCVRRSKCLPEGGQLSDDDLVPHQLQLQRSIAFARTVEEIKRDDDARAIWAEIYPALSDGRVGLLGAATSRAEAQVMRLAMLYALLDQSPIINAKHLMAALAVWEHAEASARYIFGSALGDPTADEVLRRLRAAGVDGVTRSELRQLFSGHKSSEELSRALGVLAEGGMAQRERRDSDGGRPAEVWYATAYGAL